MKDKPDKTRYFRINTTTILLIITIINIVVIYRLNNKLNIANDANSDLMTEISIAKGTINSLRHIIETSSSEEEVSTSIPQEKTQYIQNNIHIYNFNITQAFETRLLSGSLWRRVRINNVFNITFTLRNNGKRSLNKIEVTFFFKDMNGNTIADEKYYPVNYNRRNDSLKSGYVWENEPERPFRTRPLPSEWSGAWEARITDIEFAE